MDEGDKSTSEADAIIRSNDICAFCAFAKAIFLFGLGGATKFARDAKYGGSDNHPWLEFGGNRQLEQVIFKNQKNRGQPFSDHPHRLLRGEKYYYVNTECRAVNGKSIFMKKKAIVYIDGYNWYHGIFKHKPEWKWLNIESFFTTLRSDEEIISIKMFSSWIEHDQEAKDRQERYFNALKTLPKVRLIMGVFQPREVTCRSDCRKKYIVQEEKKTDVNLAVEIMDDAVKNNCERMFIVSGDADIQPAVEWVTRNRPDIKVVIYIPALPNEQPNRRTDYYATQGLKVDCKFLPTGNIKDHQFKDNVRLPGSEIKFTIRPHVWK